MKLFSFTVFITTLFLSFECFSAVEKDDGAKDDSKIVQVKPEVKDIKDNSSNSMEKESPQKFSINVEIKKFYSVQSKKGNATMILFGGNMNTDFFSGTIVDGGVDTQKTISNQSHTLSARYILEGKDAKGKPTKIFIENNGTTINGKMETHPLILTDNPDLQWLETMDFVGEIAPAGMNTISINFRQVIPASKKESEQSKK